MQKRYHLLPIFCLLAVSMFLTRCGTDGEDTDSNTMPEPPVFEVVSPKTDPKPVIGAPLIVDIKINDWSKIKGGVKIYLDEDVIQTFGNGDVPESIEVETQNLTLGQHRIKVICERASGQRYIISKDVTVLSDTKPHLVKPKLVQLYPHDGDAFTQGLTFYNGFLIEGTGLNGRSSIRKVDLVTGKVLNKKRLDDAYFGEGITMHQGKLYQITWKSKLGFVYDPNTFEEIAQFSYTTRTGEGWGLTSDGTHLILSEGTETLYFLDSSFQIVRKVNATDNVGKVGQLNELEYYNGAVWANVYGTDIIVEIEAETGRVLTKLDMAPLRSEFQPTPKMDVLNGVAIEPGTGRMIVTGKNWPRLLEVDIKTEN